MSDDETGTTRRWRVGELAEAAGLTVRALHHYEHLGLLVPSRTEANHRFYDRGDVERLYRIRALRELGLSLPEIAQTLRAAPGALRDALRDHLARAEQELTRITELRDRLRHLCDRAETSIDASALLGAVEAMSRVEHHIAARQAAGRPERGFEDRWRALGVDLRACMDDGEPPSSTRARELARRVQARLHAFTGGDQATLEALARLRRDAPPQELAGWTPALFRYLDGALAALEDEVEP